PMAYFISTTPRNVKARASPAACDNGTPAPRCSDLLRLREPERASRHFSGLKVPDRRYVEGELDLVAGGRRSVLGANAQRFRIYLPFLRAEAAALLARRRRPEIVDVSWRGHVDRDRVARTSAIAVETGVEVERGPAVSDRQTGR